MTSNTSPDDLLTYMSSGMNDVLPKPFTKEGLLNMLEKHLIHLKTVQKMDQIPKQLGLPPVSKETLEGVLQATAASAAALGTSGASGSGSGSGAGKGNGNGESSGWPSSSSPGSGKALPAAAMMGNGPNLTAKGASPPGAAASSSSAVDTSSTGGEDDPNVVNPLAAMGFSDEEYISMIQSLLAAGTVSGDMSDAVSGVMGVMRGEGASRSTPPEASGSGSTSKKRGADGSPPVEEGSGNKKAKARFEELKT